MNKEIIILMICGTGFGDQYSSLLTGYKTFKDFKSLGFNVKPGFLINNPYFSSDIELSHIWDLSHFGVDVLHIKHNNLSILDGYKKIKDGVIQVYVKNISDELNNYKFSDYGRYGLVYQSDLEFFDYQFIQPEILKMTEFFLKGKKDVFGIHARIPDDIMNSDLNKIFENDYYKVQIQKIQTHIENNPTIDFMICSNSESVKDFFLKNQNVFFNKFSTNFSMYNVKSTHLNEFSNQDKFILHAKEILAEMASFADCKKIWSINTFYSNFITYGIVHNKHHKDWESKNQELLVLN